MRRFLILLPLVALAACGMDFSGTYTGRLSYQEQCSDGTGGVQSLDVTWIVTNGDDDAVNVEVSGGTCNPFVAKQDGDKATLQTKDCMPLLSGGRAIEVRITTGTLTLSEDILSVSLNQDLSVKNGSVLEATCQGTFSGPLTRQAK
jgi:hypothetical protein